MNAQLINESVANLDGKVWECTNGSTCKNCGDYLLQHINRKICNIIYTDSYDAIIPVIQKQDAIIRTKMFENKINRVSVMTNPLQLCIALLKALKLWTSEMEEMK